MRLRGSGVGNSLPFPRGEGAGGVQVAVNRGHRYPQLLCNFGHGARPDLTNDPIKAACDLALQLSSIPSNYYDVLDHSVVSIGKITAGNIGNVIPSEAHIQGTTRQYKKGGNEAMLAVIERMAKGVGITHNVEVKVSHNGGVLPVYNDPALIPHARELVDQVEGLKVSPQTDPICAIGVTTYATLIGFGTGPTKQFVTQMMMGVPMYHAFFTMFISMNFYMVIGLAFLLFYVKKIRKDPQKSLMWKEGWRPDAAVDAAEEAKLGSDVHLSARSVAIVVVFMLQYVIIVAYSLMGGTNSMPLMVALAIVVSIICGIIARFSPDRIGNEFDKGLQSMVFVCFVIGLARVMSLVMTDGNILHTIVYVLTRPLMDLPRSVASIGMTAIISVINLVIPSATSKAAILVPIIKPIAETLQMDLDLAVQAFQYGDGFTNIVSPFLGWTIGSCAMAGVPYPTWLKWALPKVICFIVIGFVIMYALTELGWTAF